MQTPPNQTILPPSALFKGPDALRGSGYAFIYTKYADPQGHRWFLKPGHVGHETMTNSPFMLQALFGPDAQAVTKKVVELRDVYGTDARGFPAPTGEKREEYDYHEIRRLAKRENLFGRSGTLQGRAVVMLWGAPENWQAMLVEVLRLLRATPDTVVTVGTSQFLAGDFLSQDGGGKVAQAGRVGADQTANKERFDLQAQYHVATGPLKAALSRQLDLGQGASGPRPASPPDWRQRGRQQGSPYVYSYGEADGVRHLSFKSFLGGER